MNRKRGLLASGALIVLMLAMSAWAWGQLPVGAQMPVHWGLSGTPDRYGGKFEGLLLLPLIALGLTVLFAAIPWLEPRRRNLERSWAAYTTIWVATMLLLAAIHAAMVVSALGPAVNMGVLVPVIVGLLLVALGAAMTRLRSNFFAGIRTPWTLSSDLAWEKTHRLGGWLFMTLGVALALSALVGAMPVVLGLLLGGSALVTVVLVVYSYYVWKADPNKQTIGR